MDFLNCISDALNSLLPDSSFVVYVNHVKDSKFPTYVTHTIRLVDTSSDHNIVNRVRVNSSTTAENKVMRRLVSELLAFLFREISEGRVVPKEENRD